MDICNRELREHLADAVVNLRSNGGSQAPSSGADSGHWSELESLVHSESNMRTSVASTAAEYSYLRACLSESVLKRFCTKRQVRCRSQTKQTTMRAPKPMRMHFACQSTNSTQHGHTMLILQNKTHTVHNRNAQYILARKPRHAVLLLLTLPLPTITPSHVTGKQHSAAALPCSHTHSFQ